jgi:RNA polymerase sigma-70 factor (ECF subfamily)
MHSTSVSLLERLRRPDAHAAWERFVHLYTPLLFYWARRVGLQEPDAADLVQDVFAVLVQKLPEFHYDRSQSFRSWLHAVLLNKWRELQRRRHVSAQPDEACLAGLANPDDAITEFDEAEFRQHLLMRAMQLMQADFQPTTWKACWEHVVCDRPADAVAQELQITVNAVYLAKSRVLRRLRQELVGFLD